MGIGWRRAFCNTVPRDHRRDATATAAAAAVAAETNLTVTASNPSTPRLRCKTITDKNGVDLVSPNFQGKSPRIRLGSNPSSPRSPFSILKNTLRISRNSCGVCMQSLKTGQGMAIYSSPSAYSDKHMAHSADPLSEEGS